MRKWGRGGKDYRLRKALAKKSDGRVLRGPFAGMVYAVDAFASAYFPKLIGCYEREIHEILESVIRRGYRRIIDIGCAEGYYAVGLALRCPESSVLAIDIEASARAPLLSVSRDE